MAKARDRKFMMGKVTHTKPTIAVTDTELLAENVDRQWVLIQNITAARISISFDGAASAGTGIVLEPVNAGGQITEASVFEMSQGLGNLSLGAINAVSALGNVLPLVSEGE
jgi:hypothetical protein